MRFWNRQTVFEQTSDVHSDCLMHSGRGLKASLACRHTAGEVRRVGRVVRLRFFDYDKEAMHLQFPFPLLGFCNCACFKTLPRVPGARSSPGWPAMVTRPAFAGCLNCLWLPLVATRYQPSFSTNLTTSRIFTIVFLRRGRSSPLDAVGDCITCRQWIPRWFGLRRGNPQRGNDPRTRDAFTTGPGRRGDSFTP